MRALAPLRRWLGDAAGALADRSIVWSFDRTGYKRHARAFLAADLDVDLSDRLILVTGANSGIGRATAFALARRRAEVWLLCRNAERGRSALEDLRLATGSHRARLEIVDMASRVSILDFTARARERLGERRIDALIHNAGVLPARRTITADDLELTWATNVVGPFLMTWELVPLLASSGAGTAARARVINVSSGGMYTQRLDLSDLLWQRRRFDGVVAYAQTKRAEVILTELWAAKLEGSGIDVNSMHPGWADTPSVRRSLPRFHRLTRAILRTPREGADTVVWLAACERIAGETGRFFFDRRPVSTHILARTKETETDRQRLWEVCREQAGIAIHDRDPGGPRGPSRPRSAANPMA